MTTLSYYMFYFNGIYVLLNVQIVMDLDVHICYDSDSSSYSLLYFPSLFCYCLAPSVLRIKIHLNIEDSLLGIALNIIIEYESD